MKRILLLLLSLCCLHSSFAQALKKYAVGKSGCTASFYCNPGSFEESTSPDSSVVYTGECVTDGITYDIICVRLKEAAPDLSVAAQVLEQYLDFLKGSYEVSTTAGYKKGMQLNKNARTAGMQDTWKDREDNNLKVTGWTNGRFIAVLMAISAKDIPDAKLAAFMNGLSFPAVAPAAKSAEK